MWIHIRVTGYKGNYNVRTGFVDKQDGELTAKMCGSPHIHIYGCRKSCEDNTDDAAENILRHFSLHPKILRYKYLNNEQMLSNEDEAILWIFSLSVHPFPKARYFENQQRIFYWQYVACYYWIVSLDCISAQAAQIYTKIHWVFLLGGGAARIFMEIYSLFSCRANALCSY